MSDDKKAYPLWDELKIEMMLPLWAASTFLGKYRANGNPVYFNKFQLRCMDCWGKIRVYDDVIKVEDNKELTDKLDACMLGIPEDKINDKEFWIQVFNYLSKSYRKLGVTDIARADAEVDLENVMLDGLLG